MKYELSNREIENCVVCAKQLRGLQKKFCGKKCKANFFYNPKGDVKRISMLRKERKNSFILQNGSACRICFYNKCVASLHFHHIDETTKSFGISRKIAHSFSNIKNEIDKCILLCGNCHQSLHHPDMDKEMVSKLEKNDKEKIVLISGKCNYCAKILNTRLKFCDKKCTMKFYNNKNQSGKNQHIKGILRKRAFVEQLGGKCFRCNFALNYAALTFHHKDPSLKLFVIDLRSLANRNIKVLLEEVDKCELLCMNCHMEHHHNQH